MQNQMSRGNIALFFICLFLISILLLGWLIQPFISVIIMGFVITGVFRPLYVRLTGGMKPALASALTCLAIFTTIFIPLMLLVGIISQEAYDLYRMAKTAVFDKELQTILEGNNFLDRLNLFLADFAIQISADELKNTIGEIGKTVGLFLYEQANGVVTNLLSFLFNFFMMVVVIFFLLMDGDKLINFILEISPLPDDQDQKLIKRFKDMSAAVLLGNGLGGIIQGILGGVVFAIFGFSSPFLWGVIMGILAFLPIMGIGAVFIPAAVYLFVIGKTASGVFFLVFYMILSGVVEYIFKPKLVGNRVEIHPLLIFLSILGGLKLFGILGIIYGPLIATGFLTLTGIYQSSYRRIMEY